MKKPISLALTLLLLGFMTGGPSGCAGQAADHQHYLRRIHQRDQWELKTAKSDQDRFHALTNLCVLSFHFGEYGESARYADELERLIPQFKGNWDYGNAIQNYHTARGRAAVRAGNMVAARKHLLATGRSPGSPQMNSFGPKVDLAKDMIKRGEKEVVIQYFDLCRKFWKGEGARLDEWSALVRAGKMPDFGGRVFG